MFFKPHKLYKVEWIPEQVDENEDIIKGTGGESEVYLCDCFLHDLKIEIKQGLAGKGIEASHYINLDRRNDLEVGQEVIITEQGGKTIRGKGKIVDIKHTSIVGTYTVIYI